MDQQHRYGRDNPWPDLVLAMLSVNNYPLDKTFALFEALSSQGLFDHINYLRWAPEEIEQRLVAAGYDRGPTLTKMFGQRLQSLKAICGDISATERILVTGNQAEVAELLKSVKGVGPTVMRNLFTLR